MKQKPTDFGILDKMPKLDGFSLITRAHYNIFHFKNWNWLFDPKGGSGNFEGVRTGGFPNNFFENSNGYVFIMYQCNIWVTFLNKNVIKPPPTYTPPDGDHPGWTSHGWISNIYHYKQMKFIRKLNITCQVIFTLVSQQRIILL